MIADVAMVLQAESVTNTGYLAAGGALAIDADSLWNGRRNADYQQVREENSETAGLAETERHSVVPDLPLRMYAGRG